MIKNKNYMLRGDSKEQKRKSWLNSKFKKKDRERIWLVSRNKKNSKYLRAERRTLGQIRQN